MQIAITPELIYRIGFDFCQEMLRTAPKQAEAWVHCQYAENITTNAYYAVINGCVHGVNHEGSEYIDIKFQSIDEMLESWKFSKGQSCYALNLNSLATVLDHLSMQGNAELEQFIYSCFEITISKASEIYGEQFLIQCDEFHKQHKHQIAVLNSKIIHQQNELNHAFKRWSSLANEKQNLINESDVQAEAVKLNMLG